MVIFAIIALIAGILTGISQVDFSIVSLISENTELILFGLMFSVGISIGLNKNVFSSIRQYHIKIFIIPFGIIVGTIIGGFVLSVLCAIPANESTAIVSGLGWYSLSGIIITELAGAELGTIAFFSNLIRELLSFFSIPFLSKYLNYYTAIAPAAATSEDTTLPMLIKYTNEEVVVMSVFNGVICSALVPILTRFLFRVLQ